MRAISSITRRVLCAAALLGLVLALDARAAHAVGESVNGFPNWAERVIHAWINRARVDPQLEMNACGAPCVERACYGVMPPLSWSQALNRAARFHSDELVHQSYFDHTSACTVVSNINSLYPGSCDGSASCACVGGVKACSPTCTSFGQRVQLFGGSPSGEIIASSSNPNTAFYQWLYEQGDTTACQFTLNNGHRWLILKSTGAVGVGVAGRSTGDFGAGSAPTKIPSGAHYPQQAASVAMWANWYDTAGPSQASVNVDGTCTPMTLQRGTQTNGAWSATVTGAGSGCHRYYFSFRDAGGATVTYPTTGSLAIGTGASCPDWDSSRPGACAAMATATATGTLTSTATATRTASTSPSSTPTATPPATPSSTPSATAALSGEDIGGYVRYYSSDEAVPGINVHAGGATTATSDASGHYVLGNVPAQNLTVYAERTGGVGAAISALDASWVLQEVADLRTLSPQQVLACDVTGNGSLSGLDATRILQYAVGLHDRLPVAMVCESDWVFIPVPAPASGQTLIQPQPGEQVCTPGGINYSSVTASLDEQNFSALVFGDCTGNWRPPSAAVVRAAAGSRPTVSASELRSLGRGRLALPIGVARATPMPALELRVAFDRSTLRVAGVQLVGAARDALLAFNATRPGVLRIAIASSEAIAVDGAPVVVVVFATSNPRRVALPTVSVRGADD
jgi:uncharacterized protein YkwD